MPRADLAMQSMAVAVAKLATCPKYIDERRGEVAERGKVSLDSLETACKVFQGARRGRGAGRLAAPEVPELVVEVRRS